MTSFSGKALLMPATHSPHSSLLKGPKWPCQQSTPVTYLKHMKEKIWQRNPKLWNSWNPTASKNGNHMACKTIKTRATGLLSCRSLIESCLVSALNRSAWSRSGFSFSFFKFSWNSHPSQRGEWGCCTLHVYSDPLLQAVNDGSLAQSKYL